MHLRRSFAATAVAVVTAVPLLASCGFDYGTDRVYTPAAGTDDRSGIVDVLSAVVVSGSAGEGTFIATLSNNSQTTAQTFDGVEGATDDTTVPADSKPLEIPPGGFVNLADGGGVKLTGSFVAGDTVPLSVGFADGSDIQLIVPVVTACDIYAGLDPAASGSATPSASPTDAPETVDPTGAATDSSDDESDSASGSAFPSEEASAADGPYGCVEESGSASSATSPSTDGE